MRWRPTPKGKALEKFITHIPSVYSGNQEKKKHRQRFLKEGKLKNAQKRSHRPIKDDDDFWGYDA